jgi:hypothetical protein
MLCTSTRWESHAAVEMESGHLHLLSLLSSFLQDGTANTTHQETELDSTTSALLLFKNTSLLLALSFVFDYENPSAQCNAGRHTLSGWLGMALSHPISLSSHFYFHILILVLVVVVVLVLLVRARVQQYFIPTQDTTEQRKCS